jgi:hypothetical protein
MSLSSLSRRGHKGERLPKVPKEATRYVEKEVAKLKVPGLGLFETQGRYCYIKHNGEPLCRFGHRGEQDVWDFAIYKYSIGRYSTSEAFFPQHGRIVDCLRTALHAYNLL